MPDRLIAALFSREPNPVVEMTRSGRLAPWRHIPPPGEAPPERLCDLGRRARSRNIAEFRISRGKRVRRLSLLRVAPDQLYVSGEAEVGAGAGSSAPSSPVNIQNTCFPLLARAPVIFGRPLSRRLSHSLCPGFCARVPRTSRVRPALDGLREKPTGLRFAVG